jgi:5-methyltetrahydrofolate--homocysteine methyltransferase
MTILERIVDELVRGEDEKVVELTRAAIAEKVSAKEILDQGLIGGMDIIGERFRTHEIFLPEVLLAARAMQAGLAEIKPLLTGSAAATTGRVVIGTVQGDLHDIGKNLVGIMLEGAGFEVIDLGSDVSPETFVSAAKESGATVIGMSALLTTTMPGMRKVIELVQQGELAGKVRTIVGGAPVSDDFARDIGADAYAYDAANAVERVKALVG